MKIFGIFLGLALMLSAGLTFFAFPEKEPARDPVRQQYAQVFAEFAQNAEDVYHQYSVAGLTILQNHRLEGLRILKQYSRMIEALQPYLEAENLFAVCQEHGAQLAALLQQFQPTVIADVQKRFGSDGLRYLANDPEVYFLLLKYGDRLVQLANAKGPLIFELVKRQPLDFLELYYDDGLFKAISRFGMEGLLAVKTYRGMATTIFNVFADDERFEAVFRKYGCQQVIPVLYYYYQMKPEPLRKTPLVNFTGESESPAAAEDSADSATVAAAGATALANQQLEYARWALDQIYARGYTFFRQFEIAASGNVRPLSFMAVVNALEDLFLGEFQRKLAPILPVKAGERGGECEQVTAVLHLLGLLPADARTSKQTPCVYLQTGLAAVRSVTELIGLRTLDEHAELVARYGAAVIPFISQHGSEGLKLLQQTNGQILHIAATYGQDLVPLVSRYGPPVIDLLDQFGAPLAVVMRKTDGAVIPAAQTYRQDVGQILEQPEGKDLLTLVPVFGAEILPYAARYPADFQRYLLKYGNLAITALQKHEHLAVAAARQYGDDVIRALGLYGNDAARLIGTGRLGVTLLRIPPEDFDAQEGKRLLRNELPGAYWHLLTRHPRLLNTYIGVLGAEISSVAPYYFQLAFWTLTALVGLYTLRLVYKISRYFIR